MFLASWGQLGHALGGLLGRLGAFLDRVGAILGRRGRPWAFLGRLGRRPGVNLGWAPLGEAGRPLGQPWRPHGILRGRLGGVLGASWTVFRAVKAAKTHMLKMYVFP